MLYTFLSLSGNLGRLTWIYGYSSCKSSATQSYKCMLDLFVFPQSTELWHVVHTDLQRACVIILVCSYTHRGWAHRQWLTRSPYRSSTCVRDHCVFICTQGLGTPTVTRWVNTTFFTQKISQQMFFVLLTGLEPRVFGSRVRRSTISTSWVPRMKLHSPCWEL